MRRSSLGDDEEIPKPINLSNIQREKFSYFFSNLLDQDRDDLISTQDFDYFVEVRIFEKIWYLSFFFIFY